MRDAVSGREVARLGDTTDHGGEVIEAAPTLKHNGRRVALDGHLVRCPECAVAITRSRRPVRVCTTACASPSLVTRPRAAPR
jgi:uncharacterized Zn-binding protein involved in type VI secretion